MPALNFKKQFADAVESGEIRQTIRAVRKRPIKVGDWLYLYTGMRSPACRQLRTEVCQSIAQIDITDSSDYVAGRLLSLSEVKAMATSDGFDSVCAFRDFFRETHELPFSGYLIEW